MEFEEAIYHFKQGKCISRKNSPFYYKLENRFRFQGSILPVVNLYNKKDNSLEEKNICWFTINSIFDEWEIFEEHVRE